MQLSEWLERQRTWSLAIFGPGPRTKGLLEHIRRELKEIEANSEDPLEWIDVMILAFDGAWRCKNDTLAWNPRLLGERFNVMPFPPDIKIEQSLREVHGVFFPVVYGWLRVAHGARQQLEKRGYNWEEILAMLEAKQLVNMQRQWPPWQPEDQPTEHIRSEI